MLSLRLYFLPKYSRFYRHLQEASITTHTHTHTRTHTHTHTHTHYICSYIVYSSLNWESPAGNKKKERGKVFSSSTISVSDYLYKTFLFQCLFGKEGSTQPLQCKDKHQQGLYPQSSMSAMSMPVLSPCLCSIHKLSSMNEME